MARADGADADSPRRKYTERHDRRPRESRGGSGLAWRSARDMLGGTSEQGRCHAAISPRGCKARGRTVHALRLSDRRRADSRSRRPSYSHNGSTEFVIAIWPVASRMRHGSVGARPSGPRANLRLRMGLIRHRTYYLDIRAWNRAFVDVVRGLDVSRSTKFRSYFAWPNGRRYLRLVLAHDERVPSSRMPSKPRRRRPRFGDRRVHRTRRLERGGLNSTASSPTGSSTRRRARERCVM